jgi:sulfite exporter TauE/SafE
MQIPEPTTVILSVVAGSLFGLLSVPHCLGMCGPLHLAMCLSGPKKSFRTLTLFNLGRILGYTLIGLLLGLLGEQVTRWAGSNAVQGGSLTVPKCACEELADIQAELSGELIVLKSTQPGQDANQTTASTSSGGGGLAVPQSCCEQTDKQAKPLVSVSRHFRRILMYIFPAVVLLAVGIGALRKSSVTSGKAGLSGLLGHFFKRFRTSGPLVCGGVASLLPCGMLYVAFAIAASTLSWLLGGVFLFVYCLTISVFMQLSIMVSTAFGRGFSAKLNQAYPWLALLGAAVYLGLYVKAGS